MMFYLLISTCILTLIIIMWLFPRAILPILILLLPLQRYNIYVEKFQFSLKFILILLPIAALIIFFKKRLFRIRSILYVNKRFLVYSLCLLGGVALSILGSINPERSIFYLLYFCILFFFVIVIQNLIFNTKDYLRALRILVFVGSVVSIMSLMQFFLFRLGKNIRLPLENFFTAKTITAESFVYRINEIDYLRPSSTFVDVNITAGFLAVVVLLNLGYLVYWIKKERKNKVLFYSFLFIVNILAFSMTVSRSGFLGMFFALLFFILLNLDALKDRRIVVCTTLLLVLASIMVFVLDTPFDAFYERIITTFFKHDITGSTQEHIKFSIGAWKSFLHHPWNGVGAGNFEQYYLTAIEPTEDTAYSYNIYLGFLAETGLIGFISQIAFIVYIIRSSFLTIKNLVRDKERLLFSALFCGYVAILIANFFYAYYILFFVWLIIGLLLKGTVILNKGEVKTL